MATAIDMPIWWYSTRKVDASRSHPGLRLDKYSLAVDQEQQKAELEAVTKCMGAKETFSYARERRMRILETSPGQTRAWKAPTSGPLTLHLSRPSALENAGICLHPIYGFAYLPGTGLKGLARAYAETEWLPRQEDQTAAWHAIERVFGWAPTTERKARLKKHLEQAQTTTTNDDRVVEIDECSGGVVFHDAWPTTLPRLTVDIINNHHSEYYAAGWNQGTEPGDWDEPKMVYFLAVPPGTEFEFALSLRDATTTVDSLDLAERWLRAALATLGAGAKTAAGYGRFKSDATAYADWPAEREYSTTVTLVTPAFLAGPLQTQQDCDLRPATLRGLLRWWWRTLYSDLEDYSELRRLEGAIWGSTDRTGAVALTVEPTKIDRPIPFGDLRDKDKRHQIQEGFRSKHSLRKPKSSPDLHKAKAEGLFYLAYGMSEPKPPVNRLFMHPEASWRITFRARDTEYPRKQTKEGKPDWESAEKVSAEHALMQARAALWLLRRFGGVGAKCRKGFGSLDDDPDTALSLKWCLDRAREMKNTLGLATRAVPSPYTAPEIMVEVPLGHPDPWWVLHEAGFGLEVFAVSNHHNPDKQALGLPKKIDGPSETPLRHQHKGWKPPTFLGQQHPKRGGRKLENMRHASPLHMHVGRTDQGSIVFRVTAFPQKHLPDLQTSKKVLEQTVKHLQKHMEGVKQQAPKVASPSRPLTHTSRTDKISKPEAPGAPASPDRYQKFVKWFETMDFNAANKGTHAQIPDKMNEITDPQVRSKVKAFLRKKFKSKKSTTPAVWSFMNSDD